MRIFRGAGSSFRLRSIRSADLPVGPVDLRFGPYMGVVGTTSVQEINSNLIVDVGYY